MSQFTKIAKYFALTMGAILLLMVLSLIGIIFYGAYELNELHSKDIEHLPDAVLIQNFHEHRTEFELLRSMLDHDEHIRRIDADWSDPANIAEDKLKEYRHLFTIVGTPRGLYSTRNPTFIEFVASSKGWVASGSTKGHVYRLDKPEDIKPSLDKYHTENTDYATLYRRIEGNWYLYFER